MPRCTGRASPARRAEQRRPSLAARWPRSGVRLQLRVPGGSTAPQPQTTRRSRRQQKPTFPSREGQSGRCPPPHHLPGYLQVCPGQPEPKTSRGAALRQSFFPAQPSGRSGKAPVPAHGVARFLYPTSEGDFSALPPPSRNPRGKQDSFSTAMSALKSPFQALQCTVSPAVT